MHDLRDIELMLLIGDGGSLTAAAARAGITTGRVSQRLRKLEDRLGVRLVSRGAGRHGLTSAGKKYFQSACIIIDEMDNLTEKMRIQAGASADPLRIMCAESLAIDDLPQVIEIMLTESPGLSISVLNGTCDDITEGVLGREIDVGLQPYAPELPGLHLTQYKLDRICLLTPTGHALTQMQGRVYFTDAIKFGLIGLDGSKRMSGFIDDQARKVGAELQYRIRVSSLEAQAAIVARTSLGIAITVESIARRAALSQQVRMVPLADSWATQQFHLLTCDLHEMSPAGLRFMELMKKQFIPE